MFTTIEEDGREVIGGTYLVSILARWIVHCGIRLLGSKTLIPNPLK